MLESILNLLADGKFHSRQEISKILGISCKKVPAILKLILDPSINLELKQNTNYRIVGGLELLDASYIYNELGEIKRTLSEIEVLTLVDSTNNYLLNKKEYSGNYAVFAEQQTAGRGQFNRIWFSNFGKNIALSLLWKFNDPLNKFVGLTLVVGIAIVKALEEYGLQEIQLKWPNDIIHNGKKLGGILIESRYIDNKVKKVVIGIGLNLYNPSNLSFLNNNAITSIFSLQNSPPKRNLLATLILKNLLHTLIEFQARNFDYFMPDWHRLDYLAGKVITIQNQTLCMDGMAITVNTQGQLCVQIKNKTFYFNSGEIRVKLKSENLYDSQI